MGAGRWLLAVGKERAPATLVGIPCWQQAFVIDRASGGFLVPTNSTQGTVGKSQ